jgi:hypothetical protein
MVIFHSYVSLPEGTIQGEQQHRRKHRTSVHDVLVVSQILAMTRELRCQWIAVTKIQATLACVIAYMEL